MKQTIEESIQRLKAEIIAQDWRISPKRAEMLEGAFACLRERFKSRKPVHAILVMAGTVLDYIRKRGGNPPETIDFMKEAMAHVVNIHEELTYDPEREDQIFKGLYNRFTKLKEKVRGRQAATPLTSPPSPARKVVQEEPRSEEAAPGPEAEIFRAAPAQEEEETVDARDQEEAGDEDPEAARLVEELTTSLENAGETGQAIGDLLVRLLENRQAANAFLKSGKAAPPATDQEQPPQAMEEEHGPVVKPCPPTEVRQIRIGDMALAVPENIVALVHSAKKSKMKGYIKNSAVPLDDFRRLFQGLASRFTGPLAEIKESKLRKLNLPLLHAHGIGLPEGPDETATALLVLSTGSWHGIIACQEVGQETKNMVEFQTNKNGDIAGTAYCEEGNPLQLLDSMAILKREGFLLV